MPPLGAHMSIAGGYYKAVEAAAALGMETCQLFTKNNNQWRAKPIGDEDAARFQDAMRERHIVQPLSHDSYLINLASPDDVLWRKSVDAFLEELLRAERLGIPQVVTHPGAYTTGTEQEGLARVVAALDEVYARIPDCPVRTLLESTAGQGSSLGWRFSHLGTILRGVKQPGRLGVCIDTCHVFAAGYPLAPKKAYAATMQQLDDEVGLARVRAVHLNDSKKGLGSRVDRHAHIGEGELGIEPFRLLLADSNFRDVPMYLETPKGKVDGVELDTINLERLRGLLPKRRPRTQQPKHVPLARSLESRL